MTQFVGNLISESVEALDKEETEKRRLKNKAKASRRKARGNESDLERIQRKKVNSLKKKNSSSKEK
jgi:hypothetical protein